MNNNIEHLIYENKNSLSKILCNEIIKNHFNNDITIENNIKLFDFLNKELRININKYINNITKPNELKIKIININNLQLLNDKFIIKCINNDEIINNNTLFTVNESLKMHGIIHYIWILNDNIENENITNLPFLNFFDTINIYLKSGSLLFFPNNWCYPYIICKNKNPIYIIEGDIYQPK